MKNATQIQTNLNVTLNKFAATDLRNIRERRSQAFVGLKAAPTVYAIYDRASKEYLFGDGDNTLFKGSATGAKAWLVANYTVTQEAV